MKQKNSQRENEQISMKEHIHILSRQQDYQFAQGVEFGRQEERQRLLKRIIKMIDSDIAFQEKQLTGNFEKDKSPKWRIVGMKSLKGELKSSLNKEANK